jgi:hypothetical protein
VGYKFGFTLDFNPNLFHDKSVLNIQLLYFDSKVEENSDGGLKIESQTLRVPIAFKIYLKIGQRGFFVNPGVTPYYTLNYSVENDIFLAPITMNKIGGAVFAGVGWDSYLGGKKVTLNLKYEQDFLSPYNWEATQRYLQFDLGYRF